MRHILLGVKENLSKYKKEIIKDLIYLEKNNWTRMNRIICFIKFSNYNFYTVSSCNEQVLKKFTYLHRSVNILDS